jgi:hypothetical protein
MSVSPSKSSPKPSATKPEPAPSATTPPAADTTTPADKLIAAAKKQGAAEATLAMKDRAREKAESTATAKAQKIDLFFDRRDSGYWYRIKDSFVKLGTRDVKLHLRQMGLSDVIYVEGLPQTDWHLWDCQMNKMISYAGPLAGHRVGVFTSGERRCLVTEEPRGLWQDIAPKVAKAPKWFARFVRDLLPDEQSLHFLHWFRIALESLRAGDFRPGQAVVLAGPPGCGKSLLQHIITEVLGGRVANPFAYMMGEKFNYDLAGAEHWAIEDPASSTDIRTRRHFGAKLKEATVNRDIAINQKGKDALLLPLFRRATISVNHESENLSVVPPLDGSILDKVFLFMCGMADVGNDRKKTWDTIKAEVPAIRAWLLTGLGALPAPLVDARFGVKAWHHPDLIKELSDLSPENRLLELIDHCLFDGKEADMGTVWTGKAIMLERDLRKSEFQSEVQNLLKFSSACGVFLQRLLKQNPERFTKRAKREGVVWTILPPQHHNTTTP